MEKDLQKIIPLNIVMTYPVKWGIIKLLEILFKISMIPQAMMNGKKSLDMNIRIIPLIYHVFMITVEKVKCFVPIRYLESIRLT